ncbi:hypothetical protein [Porphyromonas loveana]|uniref:hypothetical protein n=1 Tax=Porphyromonas loveana TaxID=1884669 RepID=UPI00359F69AA
MLHQAVYVVYNIAAVLLGQDYLILAFDVVARCVDHHTLHHRPSYAVHEIVVSPTEVRTYRATPPIRTL